MRALTYFMRAFSLEADLSSFPPFGAGQQPVQGKIAGMVDVAIVGAGPVGLAAAIEAKRRGLSHVVVDQGPIAHTIQRFPLEMVFFSEGKNIELGGYPLVSLGPKPTRQEALRYFQQVARREKLVLRPYHKVLAIVGQEGAFTLAIQKGSMQQSLACRYVVVATGYFDNPNQLGVPGEELPHVHNRYVEAARYFGCRVAVVGGSNSAVETALDLFRGGAQVTLIHRGPDLRPTVKYWLLPDFQNRVGEGAIKVLFQTTVTAITPDGLELQQAGRRLFLPTDFVLVLIGYRANDGLLREAGARYLGDKPQLSESYETSVSGLFAIGSCASGTDTRSVFIENGREHARLAIEAIASRVHGHSRATADQRSESKTSRGTSTSTCSNP